MTGLTEIFAAIDAANAQDPVQEGAVASAVLYGQRMSARLKNFAPHASQALQIAVRGQHIERWAIARADYPLNKAGYYAWRNAQKARCAERLCEIAAACGFEPEVLARITAIATKKDLTGDRETQILEDVACLVFLEFYAADFAAKHDDEKIIEILRKTMRKMSDGAVQEALKAPLAAGVRALLERAVHA